MNFIYHIIGLSVFLGSANIAQAQEETRYIIKYKQGRVAAFRNQMGTFEGRSLKHMSNLQAFVGRMSKDAAARMRNDPTVEYVEEDVRRYPTAEVSPYGLSLVQADIVPRRDRLAGNMTVCIIDSGYDLGHPDLPSDATGSNDARAGVWYEDGSGHGTHVAGTIAAISNDEGVLGVLPNENVNLHIVRVFGDNGEWAYSSDLANAVQECRNAGANVINMSLGGPRSTTAESSAMQRAYNAGVLLIAAAGNDGNTSLSYPASYSSVVSVGGIDEEREVYSGSQQNSQVELAAPGVMVLSTVPRGTGREGQLETRGNLYNNLPMTNTALGNVSGQMVDCGLGTTTCENAAGRICLISRGEISFAEKVQACQNGRGIGAVIYNNTSGRLAGTLGEDHGTSIPAIGVTQSRGRRLLRRRNRIATSNLSVTASDYAFNTGTSMASPHVAGVAALVWSHNIECSNQQIRTALTTTAEDMGTPGRDNTFGYGLIQARAAYDYLESGCNGPSSN